MCSQIGAVPNVGCQGAVSDTKLPQVRTFEILASWSFKVTLSHLSCSPKHAVWENSES